MESPSEKLGFCDSKACEKNHAEMSQVVWHKPERGKGSYKCAVCLKSAMDAQALSAWWNENAGRVVDSQAPGTTARTMQIKVEALNGTIMDVDVQEGEILSVAEIERACRERSRERNMCRSRSRNRMSHSSRY